jgi:DNA-directed RNA polymerase specialized sigma24 family protein
MATQDDIARLLDELVRLEVRAVRNRSDSQADAIRELSEIGFGPKRISELLGTSYGTVTVTLAKAKKRKPKSTGHKETDA